MPDDTPDFSGATAVADEPDFEAQPSTSRTIPPSFRPLLTINPLEPARLPVMPSAVSPPSKVEELRKRFAPEVLQRALQTSPIKLLPQAEQRVITPTAYLTESAAKHPESGLLTTSAGLAQGIGAFTDFFSSPEGIAMLGTGNVEPAVQRGIAAAFSGQMISQTPELARQLGDELGKPPEARDKVKIANLVTQGIMNVAGSALTGRAALAPERIAPESPETTARVSTLQPSPKRPAPSAQPTAPGLVNVGSAFDKAMAGLKKGQDLPDFSKEQPAAPAAPEEPTGAAAVKPSKISLLDLEPALEVGGKPLTGGNTHAEIAQNAVKNDLPQAADAIDAVADDSKHVFVDKQGNIWTRDEASKALGLSEPLHSERLLELKKQATQPQPDWRVVVQPQNGKVPGFVQIVDPSASESSKSPTIQSLKAAGHAVPDFESLPHGSYTWAQAEDMLKARPSQGAPAAGTKIIGYHGTGGFEGNINAAKGDLGIHFTTDPRVASWFAEQSGEGAAQQVIRSELRVKKPINIPDFGSFDVRSFSHDLVDKGLVTKLQASALNRLADKDERAAQSKVRAVLKRAGYDSVEYLNRTEIYDPLAKRVVDVSDYLRDRGLDNVPRNLWQMSDTEFSRLVPDAAKTYILFDSKQFDAPKAKASKTPSEKQHADKVEQWLERAIKATESDPTKVMEGVTGAPVWITKALANGALRVVRAAYRAGKTMAQAIEDGLAWLHSEAGNNFNEDEGRKWLSSAVDSEQAGQSTGAEPTGMDEVRSARAEAGSRVTDLAAKVNALGGRRDAPVELKQQLDQALADHKQLTRQLRGSPEYVEDLLKRMEGADPATMDDIAGELAMIEPSLLNRVYTDMQKRGVIPPSAKLPEPFSSLQALTDWLKANQIDSPKRPILERLNLAKRIAAAFQDVADRGRNAWARVVAFSQTQAELWKHPPVDDDFRKIIKDWKLSDEQSGMETYRWQQELIKQIEDPKRRWAVMAWIQAGGDETLLRYQADSVPARYKPVYRAALTLTSSEKKLANQVRADWAEKLETAKLAGLLDEGRENYGPTVWKVPPKVEEGDSTFAAGGDQKRGSAGNPSAKLDTRDPFFTFHKSYPTFFDGIMAGGVPESMDVAKLVGYYNQAFNKSISSRAVIESMLDAKAKDGLPLVILSGRADPIGTDGTGNRGYVVDAKYRGKEAQTADGRPYVSVDHPALRDWKFVLRTENGKPILSRADMLVHPDYANFLKNVMETSPLRKYVVVRGALKMNRFLKESKFAISPFHMATLGEHAMSHTVNPWTGGYKIDIQNNARQRGLVRGGLDLGFSGERIDFEEGLSSHGGLWSAIPGVGDLSVKTTDLIFKDYLPAIKMKMAEEAFDRNVKRYSGKLTEDQIYDLTASQSNAAFGSQNYRLLGRSPMVRDLLSLALVAPDFLFSRMKFVGQALKPYGAEQRRALFIQMVVLYTGARVINALVDPDNNPHWGWKDAFSVIYKGRRYTLRTVVQDAWHLATDPRSFWYNRISPISRTVVETMTKKDWRGINRNALEQIEDVASWIVPISAEGLVPGATSREQGIGATVGQSFGIMSRKDTAGMEVADLARSFNRRSGDPAAVLWQKKRDQETLPDSDYRKLDRLLEDNDLKDAKKEYDRLIATGHRGITIAARYRSFRPFTGNRARDLQFYNSLSDEDKKLYDRARIDQQEQFKRFGRMFGDSKQPEQTQQVPSLAE